MIQYGMPNIATNNVTAIANLISEAIALLAMRDIRLVI
jgi:hypothetical protein